MDSFFDIVEKIRNLEIQGAEAVAKSGVKALELNFNLLFEKYERSEDILRNLISTSKLISNIRITEPLLQNSLKFIVNNLETTTKESLKRNFTKNVNFVYQHMSLAQEKIANIGSDLIKNGFIVFTHCHSSSVVNILKKAHDKGINFEVHNTETRPMFQGRKTAKELSEYGIKVVHYVDSAARIALKDADIMLFGADAITAQGKVLNKIGTEMFAEIAKKHDTEVYSAADSWKLNPYSFFRYQEIELRDPKEVWPDAPSNVTVTNYAFEKIDPDLITGIVTEFGIIDPNIISMTVKDKYPWLFKNIF